MQCRHFSIRLTPQHLIEDEDRLNAFLGQVAVHSVQGSLVGPRAERWSVLVFFDAATTPAPRPLAEPEAAPPPRPVAELADAPAAEPAPPAVPGSELTEAEREVYERLRAWRGERARADGVPPYVVAHNAALLQIARGHAAIADAADLAPLRQFGPQKAARYGAEIIRLLRGAAAGPEEALFDDDIAA